MPFELNALCLRVVLKSSCYIVHTQAVVVNHGYNGGPDNELIVTGRFGGARLKACVKTLELNMTSPQYDLRMFPPHIKAYPGSIASFYPSYPMWYAR
jgi:hypothetical protein